MLSHFNGYSNYVEILFKTFVKNTNVIAKVLILRLFLCIIKIFTYYFIKTKNKSCSIKNEIFNIFNNYN